MEQLDLLNSELLESQFSPLKENNSIFKIKNDTVISGFTFSTGVVQPLSIVKNLK